MWGVGGGQSSMWGVGGGQSSVWGVGGGHGAARGGGWPGAAPRPRHPSWRPRLALISDLHENFCAVTSLRLWKNPSGCKSWNVHGRLSHSCDYATAQHVY